jgi:hypothetical protein
MNMARIMQHLLLPDVWLRRAFTRGVLDSITRAMFMSSSPSHQRPEAPPPPKPPPPPE